MTHWNVILKALSKLKRKPNGSTRVPANIVRVNSFCGLTECSPFSSRARWVSRSKPQSATGSAGDPPRSGCRDGELSREWPRRALARVTERAIQPEPALGSSPSDPVNRQRPYGPISV
jgi:hypothetical protein